MEARSSGGCARTSRSNASPPRAVARGVRAARRGGEPRGRGARTKRGGASAGTEPDVDAGPPRDAGRGAAGRISARRGGHLTRTNSFRAAGMQLLIARATTTMTRLASVDFSSPARARKKYVPALGRRRGSRISPHPLVHLRYSYQIHGVGSPSLEPLVARSSPPAPSRRPPRSPAPRRARPRSSVSFYASLYPRHTALNSSLYELSLALRFGDLAEACAIVPTPHTPSAHVTLASAPVRLSIHSATTSAPATTRARGRRRQTPS